MNVLITGGAGLIGLAARRLLAASGHRVTAVDMTDFGRQDPGLVRMDLADAAGLEQLMRDRRIEAVVHGGGISGPVMAKDDPLRVVEVNISATAQLLDISRRLAISRFVFLSTHCVYGDVGPGLIGEERALHPGTAYAASKVAGEALVECFSREHGLQGASLRITRVYGPYRRDNCFLRSALLDASSGTRTVIPCDRSYIYHYIYVDDVVGAIAACLDAPALPHHVYNVTSGEALTMPEVVSIARGIRPDLRIELVEGVDDAPDVQIDFDLSRIAGDLGWRPRYDLAAGFAEYSELVPEATSIAA
jgi:UDP-glucuronate 4-epimerase